MIKDITLGQFFPGKSVLHKADPRIKLIASIAYIAFVFTAGTNSISCYAFLILFTAATVLVSGISGKVLLKSLKPLIFIIVFTAVINIFWHGGEVLLLDLKIVKIYAEGLIYAACMAVRIICLVIGTSVILTYTTSPISLTDGIERLLFPLSAIKIPVHEFAMMMTIALRFIPTLIEETDKIMSAQKARGADFTNGKLKDRAKALLPVLIPLFISAFRRADELAVAMECRCYRGGKGRTRMTKLRLHIRDFVILLVFAAAIAGMILLNKYLPLDAIKLIGA